MTSDKHRLRPRKQPLQVRAELTRQRILTAAAHVFAEHGYAAGTTNRIAEHARISIGSLYQYYPNKDAILSELLVRHLDDGMETVTAAGEQVSGSFEEIIRGLMRTVIENHLGDAQLLRIMIEQAPRSAELLEKVARHEQARVAYVEELLESHPEVKVVDKHTAARLVVTTVEFTVHHLVAAPDPIDVHRLEDELVAMFVRYLTVAS